MNRPPVSLATAKHISAMHSAEQLAFYVSCGVALPALLWSALRQIDLTIGNVPFTLAQIAIANLACWYALDRFRTFATARLLSYVLPVVLFMFGGLFAINSVLRTDFSFSLFVLCSAATLTISYLVTAKIRHANPNVRHFVIPGGEVSRILTRYEFVPVETPEMLGSLIETSSIFGSIVADLHFDHNAEWERLMARASLKGIPVYHVRRFEEALTGQVRIDRLHENELGSLIPNLPYRSVKRTVDLAAVILVGPVLLIVAGFIALAIKLDSRGSVLFVQERIGYGGQPFPMYKFRTMRDRVVGSEKEARREDAITKANDDRITRVGKWLRKSRLDELPQAFNILTGDMSWIGPRPEAIELSEWYEREIPFYSYRHIVRPGITGWAQVNLGHVADLDSIKSKLRFDFFYIKNLSLWLDVLIALKTVRVMLGGIGAK